MTADLRVLVRVPATAEGALHTRMTVMRCAFGRPGSSTSLFRSAGSLVSTTTGRSRVTGSQLGEPFAVEDERPAHCY
jgi:hypothetical protein